jgi:hypothetical protein
MASYGEKKVYTDEELISYKFKDFFPAKVDIFVSLNGEKLEKGALKETEKVFQELMLSAKRDAIKEVMGSKSGLLINGEFEEMPAEKIMILKTNVKPF